MKKLFFSLASLAILFTACNSDDSKEIVQEQEIDMSDFYVYTDAADDLAYKPGNGKGPIKSCATMTSLNKLLQDNPGLEKKMYDVEYHTRKFISAKGKPSNPGNGGGGGGGEPTPDNLGVINIPVYVHVVYSNSNENISDQQIASQMNVLNADFRKSNSDVGQVPSLFSGVAADSEITFSLANTFRYSNSRTAWGTNNVVKSTYPQITPSTHSNNSQCNIGGGILGYAQFPGGPSSTDGVVISPQYFGTQGYVAAPFDEGRTATHEVGHYLNLRHIWGDGRCRQDDFVEDTPTSDQPNYGCPSYPTVNCKSTDMTMNYMDYTNDACMYMFSEGQKERMRAIFAAGGSRESMVQ